MIEPTHDDGHRRHSWLTGAVMRVFIAPSPRYATATPVRVPSANSREDREAMRALKRRVHDADLHNSTLTRPANKTGPGGATRNDSSVSVAG
jgi:hypothetical protein